LIEAIANTHVSFGPGAVLSDMHQLCNSWKGLKDLTHELDAAELQKG
jgi:hypothetical protein